MPLPCPACGFLTGDESLYGTYNICPICAWEDDPVQLANPACGGGANRESLIDAQIVAVAKYPLNVMVTAKISRGSQWRPLNAAERETAETEKQVALWIHKGICDPEKVYWMTSKSIYLIDGDDFETLEEFYDVISRVLIPNAAWGKNLNAFNDILRGGFGTPDHGFVIRWVNSRRSQKTLGYPETIRQLHFRLQRCHPSNVPDVREQLAAAESGNGSTVFDWLVDIIRVHCVGGEEFEDGIELSLE